MSTVLSTVDLGKRYGARWALRNCDLAIPGGRVAALVGPNGAGKTTLLRLVVGLSRPSTGTTTVLGSEAADSSAVHGRIGFVAQDHPLYRRFRVGELLRMGRELNPTWDQQLALRHLDSFGVTPDRRAGELSGGQQAQVALTLALAKHPRLLVLDEPLASLDPLARQEFLQALMVAVADAADSEELTVLLSSHDIADLGRVCDHLVIVAAGRVQLDGAIDDLLAQHRVLSGPSTGMPVDADGAVQVWQGDRMVRLVTRSGAADVLPPWQSQPIGLEELVLAYLSRSRERAMTGPSRSLEVVES